MSESRPTTRIRSFARRGDRVPENLAAALAEEGHRYVIPLPLEDDSPTVPAGTRFDLTAEFGRDAPLIIEIGPGNGEQLARAAAEHPETNFLGIEVWHPGIARCVVNASRAGVDNIRLLEIDAAQALPVLFGLEIRPGSDDVTGGDGVGSDGRGITTGLIDAASPNAANQRASELWTFFPDPWRKARHRKRRLIDDGFARTAAGLLEPGGTWRMATDWADYAEQMLEVVDSCELFANPHPGEYSPRWPGRIRTRFETRGTEADRAPRDITAIRR